MTMIPVFKRCKRCGTRYSWNPDVGQILCPYCTRKSVNKMLKILFRALR